MSMNSTKEDTVDEGAVLDVAYVPQECTFPKVMEEYQLMEQVGSGMGGNKVFKAKVLAGPHQNELVAIKQVSLCGSLSPKGRVGSGRPGTGSGGAAARKSNKEKDELKDQMSKEISAMKKAASEHICVFHCSLIENNIVNVIMKLAAGSFKDVLRWKYKAGFPEEEERALARVLYETLLGLDALHTAHIIHRDIKASNILYDNEGGILLADFGVSAILHHEQEKRKTMAGTWHWMAPEVINPEEKGYDSSADIWSLGITTIELAYGDAPYANERPTEVVVHISTDQPPSMETPHTPLFFKPKFSTCVGDFVSCCLYVEPGKRHTTSQLLTHKLFNNIATEKSDLKRVLMDDMPSLEERFQQLQEMKNKMQSVAKCGSTSQLSDNNKLQPPTSGLNVSGQVSRTPQKRGVSQGGQEKRPTGRQLQGSPQQFTSSNAGSGL